MYRPSGCYFSSSSRSIVRTRRQSDYYIGTAKVLTSCLQRSPQFGIKSKRQQYSNWRFLTVGSNRSTGFIPQRWTNNHSDDKANGHTEFPPQQILSQRSISDTTKKTTASVEGSTNMEPNTSTTPSTPTSNTATTGSSTNSSVAKIDTTAGELTKEEEEEVR